MRSDPVLPLIDKLESYQKLVMPEVPEAGGASRAPLVSKRKTKQHKEEKEREEDSESSHERQGENEGHNAWMARH